MIADLTPNSTAPSPSKVWKSGLAERYGRNTQRSISEIDEYLAKMHESPVDLKEFWSGKSGSLKKLARIIFGQQLSSAASERLFSSAGRLVTFKRASLDPENIENIMFVKENYTFCKSALNNLTL